MEDIISDELSSLGDLYVIGTCSTPAQVYAFLHFNRETPDVIFLDSKMDERGGFHLSKWLLNRKIDSVVIGMVERDEHHSIRQMAANGISDHIYKDDGMHVFGEAIEKYRNGVYSEPASPYGLVMTDLGSLISVPIPDEKEHILNETESEILLMVINQMSTMEMAEIMSMTPDDVTRVMTTICQKTNSSNSLELRRYALKHLSP